MRGCWAVARGQKGRRGTALGYVGHAVPRGRNGLGGARGLLAVMALALVLGGGVLAGCGAAGEGGADGSAVASGEVAVGGERSAAVSAEDTDAAEDSDATGDAAGAATGASEADEAARIEAVIAAAEGELGNNDGTRYEDALLTAGGELCYERGYWCGTYLWWAFREAGLSAYLCDGTMTVYPQRRPPTTSGRGAITRRTTRIGSLPAATSPSCTTGTAFPAARSSRTLSS